MAAAEQILAVTEDMNKRAAEIGTQAGDILTTQRNVTNIFQNMGRDFSGRIPSLMTSKMIAMEDIYQGINETLNGYQDFLSNVAKTYEWNDAEAARISRTLGVGEGR
ncbi:MAG: hypothetical protein IJS39_02860 [Synergistaceae bacterium]|nr:hypothetical protein [Synergistaceae bacterium]